MSTRVRFVSWSLLPRSTTRTVTPGIARRDRSEAGEVVGGPRARGRVRRCRAAASASTAATTADDAPRRGPRAAVRHDRPPLARPRRSRYRREPRDRHPARALPICGRHAADAVLRSRSHAFPGNSRPQVVPADGCARRSRSALVVLVAAPAFAHATLAEREPGRQTRACATSPKQLELTFDENVEISFGSIALFNQKGDRVDIGRAASLGDHRPRDRSERAPPRQRRVRADVARDLGRLAPGARRLHVHGRAVVGRTPKASRPSSKPRAAGTRPSACSSPSRARSEYAGIALLIGAAVFAAAVRPHGRRRSRADGLVWVGWILLFVATIAGAAPPGPVRGRARRCRRSSIPRSCAPCCTRATGTSSRSGSCCCSPCCRSLRGAQEMAPGAGGGGRSRCRSASRSRRRPGSPATRRRERSPSSRSRSTRCTSSR